MRCAIICGDSVATTFGTPESADATAYPDLVRDALGSEDWSVHTTVFGGAMITVTLQRLEEIIHHRPDVVVLAHGTRECMLMFPRPLRRFRVHPDGDPRVESRRSLSSIVNDVRRWVFRGYLALARQPWGDRVSDVLRIRPFMPADQFGRDLTAVINILLTETSARIVLVLPVFHRMTNYPWSNRALTECRRSLIRVADGSGERVDVVDPSLALTSSDFARDGAHLSPEGHRAMATLVATAIRG